MINSRILGNFQDNDVILTVKSVMSYAYQCNG